MLRPERSRFIELARSATLVPVVKTIIADLQTPVSAFLRVAASEPSAFLLESVEGGEKVGRYTFLGIRPYLVVTARGEQIEIVRGRRRERRKGAILDVAKQLLTEQRAAVIPELPPFTCGAVGFFAYDAVRQIERLPKRAKADTSCPDALLMFFDRVLAFDHVRKQIHIIATADVSTSKPQAAYERASKDIAVLEKRLHTALPKPKPRASAKATQVRNTTKREQFLKSVERVKEYIRAGDCFQCVLSQRMELKLTAEPFDIYRALRTVNPSPYMYYLRHGSLEVLGSSPEMLVRVNGASGLMEYRPIAGTQPRGRDEAEDQRLEANLRADEKEQAEHVMLVDLGRNDLGRVSDFGSVKVRDYGFIERYSHVMHLVSSIEGKLRLGLHALDAFASCFPAGTLTGAPKVRAMEIIEELEPVRRALYGGSIFYADFAGNLDSCIAIRTMFVDGKKAYLQVGAGIVADSVPEREHEECMNKAGAVLRAIEVARQL